MSFKWYFEHNGIILHEHYKNKDKIEELIGNGDLSSLDKDIGVKHDFEKSGNGVCTFYRRDRDEGNVNSIIVDSIDDFLNLCKKSNAEYAYLFIEKDWFGLELYNKIYQEFEKIKSILKRVERK